MATIKIRENDLFRCGLVSVSRELYGVIVAAAARHLRDALRAITRPVLARLVDEYCAGHRGNGVVKVLNGRIVPLELFIWDIRPDGANRATVVLRLSLPLLAKVSEHDEIWHLLLKRVRVPTGATVRDGELCFDVTLEGDECPLEVHFPGQNGQRAFAMPRRANTHGT